MFRPSPVVDVFDPEIEKNNAIGRVVTQVQNGNDLDPCQKIWRLTSEGTHTISDHELKLIALDSPLPTVSQKDRKARCKPLGLLTEILKKSPQIKDVTVAKYVERCWRPELKWHNLGDGLPKSKKAVPYGGLEINRYVAYSWTKTVSCRRCKKILMVNAKGNAMRLEENRKNYKVCCYNEPKYKQFGLSCLSPSVEKIVPVAYDLETYPTKRADGTEYHTFYCVGYELPNGQRKCTTSLLEFFQAIKELVHEYQNPTAEKTVIHLISFNGSRYDDIFLAKPYRDFILDAFGVSVFKNMHYSERKRAITHNTATINNVVVEFCDVLRFTNPTTLANAAKDYKLAEQKGTMPFQVLNAYCRNESIVRDEDGFFSRSYYGYDEDVRNKSLAYYHQLFPNGAPTKNDLDVREMCFAYCIQDVKTTLALYHHLRLMYVQYLTDLISTRPPEINVETWANQIRFYPMLLSSMSSMAARVMLTSATDQPHDIRVDPPLGFAFDGDVATATVVREVPKIMAPIEEMYHFERKAIYGGWVKPYYQGLLIDSEEAKHFDGFIDAIKKLAQRFKVPIIDRPHVMGDIASMYPNGVTFPMPVGQPHLILEDEYKNELVERMLAAKRCTDIPLFIARVKMIVPQRPRFFESTLPQRTKDGRLSWTYDQQCADEWHYYTSLDLYVACVASMMDDDPQSVWTIKDIKEMVYYPKSGQIYKPFMVRCAEGKLEGTRTKNPNMRNCFKISMNGSIGKLGQNAVGQTNILGEQKFLDFVDAHQDNCELVGTHEIKYGRGFVQQHQKEFIVKTTDTTKNNWPQAHAAFMYSATRVMRLEWSKAVADPTKPYPTIIEADYPDPFYGDTDSKIHFTDLWKNIPPAMIGNKVGVFDLEKGISGQNIELESVSDLENTTAFCSGILGSKCYFVAGRDKRTGDIQLKFKCKGQRQFKSKTHGCRLHGKIACSECKCNHGSDIDSCIVCIIKSLDSTLVDGFEPSLKDNLPNIALIDFVFTLITGVPCRTANDSFERILSLPSSKLPDFTVSNANVSRTLSKPQLFTDVSQMSKKKNCPLLDGLIERPVGSGVLKPFGDYLEQ